MVISEGRSIPCYHDCVAKGGSPPCGRSRLSVHRAAATPSHRLASVRSWPLPRTGVVSATPSIRYYPRRSHMTSITADRLVDHDLTRLTDAAQALPADPRPELLAEFREHITASRAETGAGEAAVRTMLDRLGGTLIVPGGPGLARTTPRVLATRCRGWCWCGSRGWPGRCAVSSNQRRSTGRRQQARGEFVGEGGWRVGFASAYSRLSRSTGVTTSDLRQPGSAIGTLDSRHRSDRIWPRRVCDQPICVPISPRWAQPSRDA